MIETTNSPVSQPPITNTFQPGGAEEKTGTTEQKAREKEPQPARAESAESQNAEPRYSEQQDNEEQAPAIQAESNAPRGSYVDVEV